MYSQVTPHTGVWIETSSFWMRSARSAVTPHTGVWIETLKEGVLNAVTKSPPIRGCGLKLLTTLPPILRAFRHPPYGGVD